MRFPLPQGGGQYYCSVKVIDFDDMDAWVGLVEQQYQDRASSHNESGSIAFSLRTGQVIVNGERKKKLSLGRVMFDESLTMHVDMVKK